MSAAVSTQAAPSVPPPIRAARAAAREDDDVLFTRLRYLTAFRLIIVTALLGATVWVTIRPDDSLTASATALLYGIVTFSYVASLGYLWVLRARRSLEPLAWAQVAGDLGVATFLVYMTGGADSLFALLYPLAVVNGSVLLGRKGAIVGALCAAVLFAGLTSFLAAGLISPAAPYLGQRELSTPRLAFVIVANATAFLLTAALASYLTDQVRRVGERLSEREVDLAALSELHVSIVRSMSSGIITLDRQGRVTYANAAGEQILGGGLRDAILSVRFPSLWKAIEASIATGLRRDEIEIELPDGGRRLLTFVVNPLTRQQEKRQQGVPRTGEASLSLVFEDVTALRSMRDAMRRSDKLAVVGQLAAGLAHELRNPLASMSGAVELLSRGTGITDTERRLMDIVHREAARLNLLVTDFLDFARPRPLARQQTDIAALADETIGVFQHGPLGQRVVLSRTGEKTARVAADPSQLRQVLWNLLQNAAEASPDGGGVNVDVGWVPGGQCRLSVSDAGSGVSAEHLGHLFEPFYTTKPQGTGLGLALVHRIVEAHGGRIEVTSSPGKGATFEVILPLALEESLRVA